MCRNDHPWFKEDIGKEIEKDVFVLARAWVKEKILSPHC